MFIELTNGNRGKILINSDRIKCVIPLEKESRIFYNSQEYTDVTEQYEIVKNMLTPIIMRDSVELESLRKELAQSQRRLELLGGDE